MHSLLNNNFELVSEFWLSEKLAGSVKKNY